MRVHGEERNKRVEYKIVVNKQFDQTHQVVEFSKRVPIQKSERFCTTCNRWSAVDDVCAFTMYMCEVCFTHWE